MNVCDQCGEVFSEAKNIDFAYSTTTHADGTKEILTEPQTVSPCCEAGFEAINE